MEIKFEHNRFGRRLKSMLKVDFRRMFTMRLFYIMAGSCLAIPILTLVMTTMVPGAPSEDLQTSTEAVAAEFDNTWQIIGTVRSEINLMSMDMTTICNINMLYFLAAVFVCLFVSEDFRSGYAKNLFTVRSRKSEYVISKTLVGFVGSSCMLLAFFIGSMLGGALAGLSFDTGVAGVAGVVMCMFSKIFLMAVFVSIYMILSVVGKQRVGVSIVSSFVAAMMMYMMIPMMTPLDAGIMNVGMCFVGGVLFSVGLGTVSSLILNKTSLV